LLLPLSGVLFLNWLFPVSTFPKSFDMEVVGAASGVIAIASIAIQLAETINEIVAFGKAVQNAPTRLRALFHDLEVLAAVISHIQHLNGHVAFDNVNENALRNCQTKISNLYKIIDQAQRRLKSKSLVRRKWGAFKISLQDDEIQSIQRSIEEAKLTLQLVQTKSLMYPSSRSYILFLR
jgi:hypothetical protein